MFPKCDYQQLDLIKYDFNKSMVTLYNKNIIPMLSIALKQTIILIFILKFVSASVCGNSNVEGSQQCDDGNTSNGDGCDSSCMVEPKYRCDANVPNICKIDSIVTLTNIGNERITSKNTVFFLFSLSQKFDIYKNLNFTTIFRTSIDTSSLSFLYNSNDNLLTVAMDYNMDIQNTQQTFQLLLSSTSYFWYDSNIERNELHGVNCQLTFEDGLWMHNTIFFVMIGIIIIVFIIVGISIRFEKWIGLELIQTYQSIYFSFIFMKQFPYQFTALSESLRYASGYDDIIGKDYNRTYTLSGPFNSLSIEGQFFLNFNISLGVLVGMAVVLSILGIRRSKLKRQLGEGGSEVIKNKLERVDNFFIFLFGEVFILIVLVLMFKIMTMFTLQLSQEYSIVLIFPQQINTTLAIVSFLLLVTVIIYIANWYSMVPDNLTEDQYFLSFRFRNMKLFYPIIYLVYQILYISLVVIYFRREQTIYIVLSYQLLYFITILWIWPYNTPRKVNRIVHNATILFNQFISISVTLSIIRWRSLLSGVLQVQSNFQFKIYLFIILLFLLASAALTVVRMIIFNKDVQCFKQKQDSQLEEAEMSPLKKNILGPQVKKYVKRKQTLRQREFQVPKNNQILSFKDDENVNKYLNKKYTNWADNNKQEALDNKKGSSIVKKSSVNQASQLIKSPQQHPLQRKIGRKDSMMSINL